MKNIKTTWEFVEAYFPNYSSHDEILRNNDLTKRIEEGEDDLEQDLNDSNAYIYEKAIKGYLESLKSVDKQVVLARETLQENGYYTDNLWHVEDVKSKYKCNDEEAMEVLEGALTNDATMEQVWLAIDIHAEDENLPKYADDLFVINGYYKDDKTEFENYLVYAYDCVPEDVNDEDIFFYGLSEEQIISTIKEGENTDLDFVITSYEKATI